MPIYEIKCQDCGRSGEVLVLGGDAALVCPECGSAKTEKLISTPSPLSGRLGQNLPGPADRACCGTSPAEAGCAGPGSCCGKASSR